jgi:hypothetical protein
MRAKWQQSQQPQTKITQEESEIKGTSTKTETINLSANPKYADTILKIQERRSRMLAYDFDHTGGYPNIQPNLLDGFIE